MQSVVDRARSLRESFDWVAFRVKRRLDSRVTTFRRRVRGAPPLPRSEDGRVRVHLGCGKVAIPGFINVDAWPAAHVHYVHDVTRLPMFADDSVDLVYACHVLEHIPPGEHRRVLWEWRRVLKRGGVLRLSVPDFDKLLAIYEATGRDVTAIRNPLIGDEGYNHHQAVINERYLNSKLTEVGFSSVRAWDTEHTEHTDYRDWSSKTLERSGRQWPISLNLEGVK